MLDPVSEKNILQTGYFPNTPFAIWVFGKHPACKMGFLSATPFAKGVPQVLFFLPRLQTGYFPNTQQPVRKIVFSAKGDLHIYPRQHYSITLSL